MTRARLPNRRASVTLEFEHVTPGLATIHYAATVGFHEDGRIGEVFLNTAKVGTDLDVATKDAAILLSFALQHGATVADMRASMTRDATGRPEGVMGTLLDMIAESHA